MVFVRVKKVRGNKYGYAVENGWTLKGPRQKVVGYLGRVYKVEEQKVREFEEFLQKNIENYLEKTEYEEIIKDFVEFQIKDSKFEIDVVFDRENLNIKNKKRKIVLAINEGYLCDYTLEKLLKYDGKDETGFVLADLITAAGLKVPEKVFVALFQKEKRS